MHFRVHNPFNAIAIYLGKLESSAGSTLAVAPPNDKSGLANDTAMRQENQHGTYVLDMPKPLLRRPMLLQQGPRIILSKYRFAGGFRFQHAVDFHSRYSSVYGMRKAAHVSPKEALCALKRGRDLPKDVKLELGIGISAL